MPRTRTPRSAPKFGQLLRQTRVKLGLSVSEVARRTGLSQGYLSRVELGEAQAPSEDAVLRVAEALGMEPTGLLEVAELIPSFVREAFFRTPDVFYLISQLGVRKRQELFAELNEHHDVEQPRDNPSYESLQRLKRKLMK